MPELSTPPAAIFDLDGTLLDGDSTTRWMISRLTRAPLRLAVALAALPLVAPLFILWRRGASVMLWIASVGLDEAGLRRSFAEFAQAVDSGGAPLAWRSGGVETLTRHLEAGDRVAVVTAAPLILARALIGPRWPQVEVLGSSLKRRWGGWVGGRHCKGGEKCAVLAEAGYGVQWAFAYSDSADDLPMLQKAEHPRLVNPRAGTERRIGKGTAALETLWW